MLNGLLRRRSRQQECFYALAVSIFSFIIIIINIIIFFNNMPTTRSKYTMSEMSATKLKIMSKFNNSLRITFSVQNYILLDARFYWRALSCVCAGADYIHRVSKILCIFVSVRTLSNFHEI